MNSNNTLSSARERRAQILKKLETQDEILVTELSEAFQTSEVTIRKDLSLLQGRGLVLRTRGGAMRYPSTHSPEDTTISQKSRFNFQEKNRIGEAAARLLKEGDHIFLDSGTTTLYIARHLEQFQHLYIITNSIQIAEELTKYQRFNIIVIGGNLRIQSHSTVGPMTTAMIRNFTGYKLFLGVDSFSFETGISTPNIEEALVNQQMIENAEQVIAVFDASKFDKRSFTHVCSPSQIDIIITDSGATQDVKSRLRKAGITTIYA